jgi:hypothetical protein
MKSLKKVKNNKPSINLREISFFSNFTKRAIHLILSSNDIILAQQTSKYLLKKSLFFKIITCFS